MAAHTNTPLANDLPEVSGEVLPMAHNQGPGVKASTPEKQGQSAELPGAVMPAPLALHIPTSSPTVPTSDLVTSPPTAPPATGHVSTPAVADDADLIEKEWVHRAKALVSKTKDDPHEQNKEMSKFKADYIKKRYNKEIKVSEG